MYPSTTQKFCKIIHKGSAVILAAVMGAAITSIIALSVARMWNTSYNVLNTTSLRNQAMQYALNGADTVRATRYDDLQGSPLAQVGSTRFYRSISVENDAEATDRKVATVKVFGNRNDDIPLAEMVVKKSRVSEVLYDTIGTNTDGAMTQEASSRLFALVDNAVIHGKNTAVGNTTRPIYVDTKGNAKVLSGTVGSATEPIWLKNGVFTKISNLSGGWQPPDYSGGKSFAAKTSYTCPANGLIRFCINRPGTGSTTMRIYVNNVYRTNIESNNWSIGYAWLACMKGDIFKWELYDTGDGIGSTGGSAIFYPSRG